jgi:hypothetical protein
MSFVVCYLPYFRQWLITCLLSALLLFQLLAPPFSSVLSDFPPPLLCASFQFVVYCSIFFFFFLQGKLG